MTAFGIGPALKFGVIRGLQGLDIGVEEESVHPHRLRLYDFLLCARRLGESRHVAASRCGLPYAAHASVVQAHALKL